MKRKKRPLSLTDQYPPSQACDCEICRSYCKRPGWWTVEEAARALHAGYAQRMMLEISPELTFGVLSPAFKGCEKMIALQQYANSGCTFFSHGLCELHGTGYEPLECLFCHHERQGMGQKCHEAIENDWQTARGQALVNQWMFRVTGSGFRVGEGGAL